jgi:hypothetical protein
LSGTSTEGGRSQYFRRGLVLNKDDQQLRDALRSYLQSIFRFLEERKSAYATPLEIFQKNAINLLPFQEEKMAKDFQLFNLPGANETKEAMRNHPVLGRQVDNLLGTNASASIVTVWNVVFRIVNDLLNRQDGTRFDESSFEDIFESMMTFFKSSEIPIQIIAPLENFETDSNQIALPNGWRITEPPDELQKEWQRQLRLPAFYSFGPVSHIWAEKVLLKEYVAERKILPGRPSADSEPQSLDSTEITQLQEQLHTIVSALRILKEGGVIHRTTIQRGVEWHVGSPGGGLSWKSGLPDEILGMKYSLQSDEVPELAELIVLLEKNGDNEEAFQGALQRLNDIVERGHSREKDKVVDAVIGLESLFLFGINTELKYRLCLRAAILLGDSSDERKQSFNNLALVYDLRSAIIHGHNTKRINKLLKGNDMTMQRASRLAESLLRESLKRFLRRIAQNKTISEVLKAIDDSVI